MFYQNDGPVPQGIILRPRVHSLIEKGLQYPVLMLLAGPGYGKTQAMQNYLAQTKKKVLWLQLTQLDNLPAHFWEHFLRTVKQNFPTAFTRVQTLEFPDSIFTFDVFVRIFSEMLSEEEQQVVWVFDDFGEIYDPKVNAFVKMLTDAEIENFCLVLLSNVVSSTESVAFMTSRQFLILGKDLKFTEGEVRIVFEMQGQQLDDRALQSIMQYTEGWPMATHLLALQRQTQQNIILSHIVPDDIISQLFERRFFASYPESQQKLFIKLSSLNFLQEN